jgi:hypothetical protein
VVDLGGGHLVAAPASLQDRSDDGALVLERMSLGQMEVEVNGGGVHRGR